VFSRKDIATRPRIRHDVHEDPREEHERRFRSKKPPHAAA
jgi:hypothetical protein